MQSIPRRAWLRTVAGLGAVGVAGCNGGPGDGGDPTATEPSNGESADGEDAATPEPTLGRRLQADDADTDDRLGWAVALAGETALLGAPRDENPNGSDAGSAYVFERAADGWQQRAKLAPADGDRGDRFGEAVALAGDVALVGAPRDEDPNGPDAGSAYVFERTDGGWRERDRLAADDGQGFDRFGASVALADGTALVGAPGHASRNWTDAGAVYVFERSGGRWAQTAKIDANDRDRADSFGRSLALEGDTAVVGADGDEDPNGPDAGSAYVFVRAGGGWTQQSKLAPDGGDPGARFGAVVSLAGDAALVGAPNATDADGASSGAVYEFGRAGGDWRQRATLRADDGDEGDRFGAAVAVGNGWAAVGAPRDEDPNRRDAGSAYVFRRDGDDWSPPAKVAARYGEPLDRFGQSVALAGETILVGTPQFNAIDERHAGAAHVFER